MKEKLMSSIYIIQQDFSFADSPLLEHVPNKIARQSAFSFPSNVIGCSLTISNLDALRSRIYEGRIAEAGNTWTSFGAGIENVSYLGTQVYFTAWMQLLAFIAAGGIDEDAGFMCPLTAHLTIQAIAECE